MGLSHFFSRSVLHLCFSEGSEEQGARETEVMMVDMRCTTGLQ